MRLLKPRSIAVVGGSVAAEVVRQCQKIGYEGEVWPVNPRRQQIGGIASFPSIEALPAAPDATFIAVPREETISIVAALARRGAGGAVCYASGFAEVGGDGVILQERLIAAAGGMALLGPNCYGAINYLDGCALWPDPLGGERVERGVAILTQSGNIALNLTLQGHHLPIAYMVTVGNKAVTDIHEIIAAFLDDGRVTAIGLYLEGLNDVPAFAAVAQSALARGIPLVVLKAGRSAIGAELAASHTRSLAGADTLYTALFQRMGIARVGDLAEFLETLKLLHCIGPLPGTRIGSLSCSGGDALLIADLGKEHGLEFPTLPPDVVSALEATLGPLVPIHNPLDYQAYIWEDAAALRACFGAMLAADLDVCLIILDIPHHEGVSAPGWDLVVDAFIDATAASDGLALMVSSLPELMPAHVAKRLMAAHIAPMQGLRETALALAAAARIGRRRRALATVAPLPAPVPLQAGPSVLLSETVAKRRLAAHGLRIPAGEEPGDVEAAVRAADAIGYPVVLKAIAQGLAHKTEADAVKLNLTGPEAVREAARDLMRRFGRCYVEEMVGGALAELIVGVAADPQFGLALTVGAGGIWVELLADSVTVLLPASREEFRSALVSLRAFALLEGHRGRARADLERVLDAMVAIAAFAEDHAGELLELDINPLIVTEREAIAVDALVCLRAGTGALGGEGNEPPARH